MSRSVPTIAPITSAVGGSSGSAGLRSSKLAASSSGASGAQRCHVSTREAAVDNVQVSRKLVMVGAGTGSNVRDVTTPRRPAPPPRSPQNRSDK